MTSEAFVAWAEAYYGEYRPVVKAEVLRFLEERGPVFTAGVKDKVMKEYSNQYRNPPDVAQLFRHVGRDTYELGRKLIGPPPDRIQIAEDPVLSASTEEFLARMMDRLKVEEPK